ncbi:MAG: UvrD-helicase domain-containing protein [bacterium]|nr:UvrD-helicase domain-containing protein [bacterium]
MSLPMRTIIPAGAGSGKTYRIQKSLAEWVNDELVAPERIAAVTYTEAAAAELRGRIRGELVSSGRLDSALSLDRAYISTIHGFGSRLLREFAFEAGVSPAPRLLTDDEAGFLIGVELAATSELDFVMHHLGHFGYTYDFGSKQSAEASLRRRVAEVIKKLREIGHGSRGASEVVHLADASEAFLRKLYGPTCDAARCEQRLRGAVEEIRGRFPDSLVPQFEGNDAATKAFRKDHRALAQAAEGDRLSNDWSLWKSLSKLRISVRGGPTPEGYDELASEVMEAAAQLAHHPGPLEDAIHHLRSLIRAADESLARFGEAKRRRGLVDYTDMIAEPWQLLAERSDVVKALSSRIDCLVIDEFQDTNPLQFALLWRLHDAGIPALVVGDIKQAIMGFQGADPRLFEQLPVQFPESTDPLATNWRSQEKLLAFLNCVGKGLFNEDYVTLESRAEFESELSALQVIEAGGSKVRKAESALLIESVARIRALLDDEEARVWDADLKCHRRLRGSDIAVLAPKHASLDTFGKALRSAGIRVRRQQDDWIDSPIVRLTCQALAYVADPADRHAALAVAVTELGQSELGPALSALLDGTALDDPALTCLDAVIAGASDRSVPTLLAELCEALGLWDQIARWPDAAAARADLLKLHADATHFHEAPPEALASAGIHGAGPKSFLAWLPLHAREDRNKRPEPRVRDDTAVVLATWHAAKGREWPIVLLTGLDEKVEPRLPDITVWFEDFDDLDGILDRAALEISPEFESPEASDRFKKPLRRRGNRNAHRLLYVALTRARESLILQWPEYLREKLKSGADEANTYWSLLREAVGLELGPEGLTAGGETYPCRVIHAEPGGDEPQVPEVELPLPTLGRRAIVLNDAPDPSALTPDQIAPSELHAAALPLPASLRTVSYAQPFEATLPGNPAERGNLLHRAFEILFGHPERRELLARGTGVELPDDATDAICTAVVEFEEWLTQELNPTAIRTEVPFLAVNENGSTVHGAMDLLVETSNGSWVFDHKSDQIEDRQERFGVYWPQLEAYAAAVKSAGGLPVRGVAVNWISEGEAMLMEFP